jgi:hypothetical protein
MAIFNSYVSLPEGKQGNGQSHGQSHIDDSPVFSHQKPKIFQHFPAMLNQTLRHPFLVG